MFGCRKEAKRKKFSTRNQIGNDLVADQGKDDLVRILMKRYRLKKQNDRDRRLAGGVDS